MALGEWLNRNPAAGIGIAVVALVIGGVVAYRSFDSGVGKPKIAQRYFYDLASGELFLMGNTPAPVTTESGTQAVWAHVFSCGSCDDTSQRFIAYLQKLSDEAKQESNKPQAQQDPDVVLSGVRVAMPPRTPDAAPQ